MSTQILFVFMLNFIISIIGTVAYSARLVGVRTGKIAITFALFNILMLVSRLAVTFQDPILTKYVEHNLGSGNLSTVFYQIIFISGIATVIGALLIPTFQRILYRGVQAFAVDRSVPKLIIHSFSKSGIRYMRDCIALPAKENVQLFKQKKWPKRIFIYNLVAVAVLTVGGLAPVLAGNLEPAWRATCLTLSPVINGFATVLMTILIDPQLSIMTDDVIDGKCSEEEFRFCVIGMVGSKTLGTFASLLLLLPAAYLIVFVAKIIPS